MDDIAQSKQNTAEGEAAKPKLSLGRLIPLVVLVAGLISFFAFGINDYITFEALRGNREALSQWVSDYGLAAAFLFILTYTAVVAFSLPGGAIMTISGGFLFGLVATVYVVIGATLGATILFLAAKTALGDALRARAGGVVKKMEDGFRENAFSYLLFLRLVPAFPFWLVNLVPAFLGVSLKTYVIATFIGIIPGSAVYASVGNGLGAVFDAGQTPDLGIIFRPEILLPIIGLAVLALLPVIYTKFSKKPSAHES